MFWIGFLGYVIIGGSAYLFLRLAERDRIARVASCSCRGDATVSAVRRHGRCSRAYFLKYRDGRHRAHEREIVDRFGLWGLSAGDSVSLYYNPSDPGDVSLPLDTGRFMALRRLYKSVCAAYVLAGFGCLAAYLVR